MLWSFGMLLLLGMTVDECAITLMMQNTFLIWRHISRRNPIWRIWAGCNTLRVLKVSCCKTSSSYLKKHVLDLLIEDGMLGCKPLDMPTGYNSKLLPDQSELSMIIGEVNRNKLSNVKWPNHHTGIPKVILLYFNMH